jgi:hypothetical protein
VAVLPPNLKRALSLAFLVVLSIAGGVSSAHATAPRAIRSAPAPLPSDRLQFGLNNLDAGWMTSSGVPWRYRFQYLSAGVNTGKGWETWQDPAKPPGQFALDYMNSSTTSPANYIPVFTYYELLQSSPSTGSSESTRDFSNLNNASTMNAYYANFKLLMQKAGAYGAQVVVHVEPDFWGYMQQHAAGAGASAITAMVKSSNFVEASAYPDNLVGFASELKFLRDTYAPNALLAMHASMWSSGFDIASNTSPSLNAAGEADKTAAFLNSAGAAGWDAIFNDVDDHNAAWWELKSCGTPPCVNQYYTRWWDAANVKFPNFARYESWVGELHAQTGKQQVVWQVPMGNQYFLTMNNTCGHYQDNVAPYFIAHANELFNAGLVAVMFGGGNSCQTNYNDAQADGITNNSGVATTDSLGGCNACNTHASVYPDDDGGYLRIFVGAYYTACTSATLATQPTAPQASGTSITFTASSTLCSSPQYKFWVLPPGGSWTAQTAYGGSSWVWNTSGLPSGIYQIGVWARQSGASSSYEAFGITTFSLGVVGCLSAGLSPGVAAPQARGTKVTFTASSTGCGSPQYRFWVLPPGGSWTAVQAYGAGTTWQLDTSLYPAGNFQLGVWARQSGSTSAYDSFFVGSYWISPASGCVVSGLNPSSSSPQGVGATLTFTPQQSGCSQQYRFWLLPPGGSWRAVQAYGVGGTWTWNTTGFAAGTYEVGAWEGSASTPNSYESYAITSFTLGVAGCTSAALAPNPAAPQTVGTAVTFTSSSTGCAGAQYEFWLLPPGGTWTAKQPYSGTTTWGWNTTGSAPGVYQVGVWARQAGSSALYDTYFIVTYQLSG